MFEVSPSMIRSVLTSTYPKKIILRRDFGDIKTKDVLRKKKLIGQIEVIKKYSSLNKRS